MGTKEIYVKTKYRGMNDLTMVKIGNKYFYFSFEQCIGFGDINISISENIWGRKTGKHLNYLSDKRNRIPRIEFENKLKEYISL